MDFFEVVQKRASVRKFFSVELSDEDMTKILDAGRRAPSGKNLQPVSFIVIRSKETLKKLERVQGCLGEATAAIAVVSDPTLSQYWLEDACAATTQMLLAIKALGYDSVWLEGTLAKEEAFAKELLGVPDHLRLIIMLPIGGASMPTDQKPRKPLSEVAFKEKWQACDEHFIGEVS